MDALDEVAQSLIIKIEPLSLAYWRPHLAEQPDSFAAQPIEADRPVCPEHSCSLHLKLQLVGRALPDPWQERFRDKLIQLWLCPDPGCNEYLAHLTLLTSQAGHLLNFTETGLQPVQWQLAGTDTPMPDACRQLCQEQGIWLSEAESALVDQMVGAESGDKLGGWPDTQDMLKAGCPSCGQAMQMLAQLAQTGYLCYCPDHHENLIFIKR